MDKIRFGVFGLWRGEAFVNIINTFKDDAILTAVCDIDSGRREHIKDICKSVGTLGNVRFFEDFDSFIRSGMDVVVLANYFHDHAKYAIQAMKLGIHVISECTAAATLKECVELCRTVEQTGCKYMLAENYPFTRERLEMARLAKSGVLGKIMYAEGEYNHGASRADLENLTPGKYHWRAWLPRTYYVTHALGPLMYMADTMPKTVNARAVHSDRLKEYDDFRHNYDSIGMMFCTMDNGALFRFTGCTTMPSPSGYRIVGEVGAAESGRAVPGGSVFLTFNGWEIPQGFEQRSIYAPEPDDISRRAEGFGHGGGDYYIIYNMIEALKHNTPYFFDVYRGAAMSAVAIYGWRSILNDGATYYIPNFRYEEDREIVERDDLTPFPDENGNGITLPCASRSAMAKAFIN